MRIGIVTENYFPSVGGTEVSIWSYTRSLRQQGHEVFVFCPSLGSKNPKKEEPYVVRLPSIRGIYPDHPLFFIFPGVVKKFRSYQLDVLHSQTPVTAPYFTRYIAKRLAIPHVHTMHTLVPEQVRRWRHGIGRMVFLYLLQSVLMGSFKIPKGYLLQDDKQTLALKVRLCWIYMLRLLQIPNVVIFPARHVLEVFRARGFRHPAHLLPTFSDMFTDQSCQALPTQQRADDEVRIIHVGRMDIEKRPQVVIDAVNLLPSHLRWRLIIVGDGRLTRKLKRLVRKYKLRDRVEFRGILSQPKIAQELCNADMFVMTSYRFDTQGIVLLEACGAGLPIVYCDDNLTVGVEKTNSLLAKPFAWSMSQSIQQLIEDKDLRASLAQGSLAVAKKYRPDKLTQKLVAIYKAAQVN